MTRRWRARGHELLRRRGYEVTRLLPGAFLVSRTPSPKVRKLAEGSVLVTRRRAARKRWLERERALAAYLSEEHIAGVLRLYRVNCVLDVGANRGQYARGLRRAGYKGHIVSFEPVRSTFEELQQYAADDPTWSVHRYALGRKDATMTMNVVPGTMSSILRPTAFGAERYAHLREPVTEEVSLRRLDGLLDDVLADVPNPRLYLKLDTQGFDLEAFAGLGARAREFVGLQSEVSLKPIYAGMPRISESLEVYEAAGFEVTGLYAVSREASTARALEFDCVMVRAEAVKDRPGDLGERP